MKRDQGHMHERVEFCEREKSFASHWEKENDRKYGRDLLQALFRKRDSNSFSFAQYELAVDDKQRFVAATVVQWLGTNCGMSFLTECLRGCGYRVEKTYEPEPEPERPTEKNPEEIERRRMRVWD